MKKITLLLIAVFVLSAANLYAQQQRVFRDGLGFLLHQMYFDYVPENEFNQVYQNFMKTNYPGKNIFNAAEVRDITANFLFSFMDNEAVMDKWNRYADAAKAREAEQQAKKDEAARQNQAATRQTQPTAQQPQTQTDTNRIEPLKPAVMPPAATGNGNRSDTMVSIPYKIEGGTTWSWQIFQPSIPNDVPQDIYNRLGT